MKLSEDLKSVTLNSKEEHDSPWIHESPRMILMRPSTKMKVPNAIMQTKQTKSKICHFPLGFLQWH